MSTAPLAIYVLWHPAAAEAGALASEVYRWFHASSDDLLRSGMGVPVFFRSQPWSGESAAPRSIRCEEADLNVVVVLAESNLVADPAWTAYIGALARAPSVQVIPVSLHESAYRLPEVVRRLNYLRVDERDDPPARGPTLHARRVPRLLRQMTEIVGRRLAARLAGAPHSERAPLPLTIFLSHAKRDGVDVAEALRSVIQNHGQLRAYLDDSDLPVGHAFAAELEHAASAGTAAMIAIVSDAYAARPWCRREVALARAPRMDPHAPNCWSIQPLLVVDDLQSAPTRSIPELGNATLIRWTPERALSTVDLLMLEVLLGSYHRLRARTVPAGPERHVIAWTPDIPSLLALLRTARTPVCEVVYPGHALPRTEREGLRDAFPQLQLLTFEEADRDPIRSGRAIEGRTIGLSVGYNEDLGRLGLGREHLEEITLRIARCVIEAGGRLAFGGMLGSSGLTETLLTLVRALRGDDDDSGAGIPDPRILSYQRWPALPSREQVAKDVGICEYVLVDTPVPADQRLAADARVDSPRRAREHAHALSAMRRAMAAGGVATSAGRLAPPLDARILAGGLRGDFNGFMPGILEEGLYALEAGIAVFVVGGFGGGGALLAQSILEGRLPPQCSADYHRADSSRFRMLEKGLDMYGEAQQTERIFARLQKVLREVWADPSRRLDNGLDRSENERLMQSDHVAEVIELLGRGLERRFRAER